MTLSPLISPLSYTLAQAAQRIGGGMSERKLRDMVRNGVIGFVWHANGRKAIPETAIVEKERKRK